MSHTKPVADAPAAIKLTPPKKSSTAHRVTFPFSPSGRQLLDSGSHSPLPVCEEAGQQQPVFTFSAVAASPAGVTQASSYTNT